MVICWYLYKLQHGSLTKMAKFVQMTYDIFPSIKMYEFKWWFTEMCRLISTKQLIESKPKFNLITYRYLLFYLHFALIYEVIFKLKGDEYNLLMHGVKMESFAKFIFERIWMTSVYGWVKLFSVHVHCDAVITRSIFSQIFTKDIP